MHRGRRTPPLPQFALLFLFVLLSSITTNAIPPNNTNISSCAQFSCGGQGPDIHYPFWIAQNSTTNTNTSSYCGYPSLQLVCRDQTAALRLPSGDYTVTDINYSSRIISLADPSVLQGPTTCPRAHQNVSIWPNSSLHFTSNDTNLVFYMNCSFVLPIPLLIGCLGRGAGLSFIFWKGSEIPVDHELVSKCEEVVVVPVLQAALEENVGVLSDAFGRVLQRGFELGWETEGGDECRSCERIGGSCGYSETGAGDRAFVCHHMDGSQEEEYRAGGEVRKSDGKSKTRRNIAIGVGMGVGVMLVASLVCLSWHKLRQRKQRSASSILLGRTASSEPCFKNDPELGKTGYQTTIFTYEELEEATNGFSASKELGDGGFGTVYKGKLRDGRVVAVKRLYEHNYKRVEQFMNEVEILSRLHHQNLVSLYGCTSRHSRELLLVYEYVPNGTVADHLHGPRAQEGALTWPIRLNIAIETADALGYLHAVEPQIIHRDVKTNNILLDNSFHVKVADFGLSRLFPLDATHVSTAPQGTPGYVDPEYHQCYQLTDKSDVYSFGVVLAELISSKPAVDTNRTRHEINLANMTTSKVQNCQLDQLVDPSLGYQTDWEMKTMITLVAELAFRCLQLEREMRPSIKEVLEVLREIESGQYKTKKVLETDVPVKEDASLLKNTLPYSPDSVTARWESRSTTPNTSG
ncbi:LEAF RUST 10 DISEASE-RESISTANCEUS RECEPTOR-LIKE PROTEIN KINASE-like 1.2 isoform X1 [Elaeis guineensis]|uniref:non-specific serine/threonine protein kinase n=1 Tax=Elaeis guineensis var. tenera TaxID=51953 RepID=A0A6I9QYB2_ELAGV|nr:LEAF RUST 10 DISEASE-RESISTANCE LOCUS RECEPTOR-LIKE PROTEIN KINASE-like 1.2 isoform X2 [Elaeis guineensis]